nr:hypothetical protein [Tanacetum cinerariifolium]
MEQQVLNLILEKMVAFVDELKVLDRIVAKQVLDIFVAEPFETVYLKQFWKTVSKVPDTKNTIRFKLDTQEIVYTVDMFHDNLKLPMETLENLFVAPVNIEIIKPFKHMVGYQGVVDKTKINILQVLHAVVNHINVDYAALLEEGWNVTVRGMLILDAFLTKEIHATDDYKETTPRAHRTPTFTASPQRKKRKQSVGETSSPQKSLKVTIKQKKVVEGENEEESYADKFAASMLHDDVDDFKDRIETESHKEHLEVVDDDVNKEDKKDDEIGSLENRTEKIQKPILTTLRSPRINLSSDKNIAQELTDSVSLSTSTTSKDPHKKRRISTYGSKGIRRIGNWSNDFSCKVQALIHRISLVGYGVLDIKTKDFIDAVKDYYCCWSSWKRLSVIPHEEINQKFLRSLSQEWTMHTIVWRNKPEIETLNLDDLFNNLKAYESKVMGTSNSTTNSHNVAFLSYSSTNSTTRAVNTAQGVNTASTQGAADSSTIVKNLSDAVIYSFFAS